MPQDIQIYAGKLLLLKELTDKRHRSSDLTKNRLDLKEKKDPFFLRKQEIVFCVGPALDIVSCVHV